jgi:hypothetical protein
VIERPDHFVLNPEHFATANIEMALLGHRAGGERWDDSTAYDRHGTIANASLNTAWQRWHGRWSVAADGIDDYMDFGNILNDVWTGDSFSGACRIYTTLSGHTWCLCKIGDVHVTPAENQRQWRFAVQSTGQVDFAWYGQLDTSMYRVHWSTDTIPSNVWTHIAVSYNASAAVDSRVSLWINGISVANAVVYSKGSTGAIQAGTARLGSGRFLGSVGATPAPTLCSECRIADLIVYRGLIPSTVVQTLADPTDAMLGGLIVSPVRRNWVFFPAAVSGWKPWYAAHYRKKFNR